MGKFLRRLWRAVKRRLAKLRGFSRPWLLIIIVVVALNVLPWALGADDSPKTQPIAQLFTDSQAHKVKSVQLQPDGNEATITLKDHNKKYTVLYTPDYGAHIIDYLRDQNVPVTVAGKSFWSRFGDLIVLAVIILTVVIIIAFSIRRSSLGGRSASAMVPSERPRERFTDVVGADEVIAEIRQTVDVLRNPKRYKEFGVRPSTGFLLYGDPGTGKTLLARAVAGEAQVPFFPLKGSDFQGATLNEGPKAVKNVFAQARKVAPAIIFIDELDSVAEKRGGGGDSGSRELNNTLNQLLHELDGFTGNEQRPVVVIAATNRRRALDPAILRPGRLTRQILMPAPDKAAREQIIRLHAKKLSLADDVDIARLVRLTSNESGAVLGNLANTAGLLALREDPEAARVHMRHFLEALDSSQRGLANKNRKVAEKDRRIAAIHEAGHTLVAMFTEHAEKPERVTIIARGDSGGHTRFGEPEGEYPSVAELKALMAIGMGGRAAEKLVLGEDHYTTGASNDLSHVTDCATMMVCEAGMTGAYSAQVRLDEMSDRQTARAIEEINKLVSEAEAKATAVLAEHRDKLTVLYEQLLALETLEGDDLKALFADEPAADA